MNLKIEDIFLLIIDSFAVYGALKAVPTLNWYSWILPGIFTGLGMFYFWGKVRYDGSKTREWGNPDQKL